MQKLCVVIDPVEIISPLVEGNLCNFFKHWSRFVRIILDLHKIYGDLQLYALGDALQTALRGRRRRKLCSGRRVPCQYSSVQILTFIQLFRKSSALGLSKY